MECADECPKRNPAAARRSLQALSGAIQRFSACSRVCMLSQSAWYCQKRPHGWLSAFWWLAVGSSVPPYLGGLAATF
eukprot:11633837-Alexandrium_andersonii.AAC.1